MRVAGLSLLLSLVLTLGACTGEEPVALPTPEPTTTAEPTAEPTPEPEPDPEPVPFSLNTGHVRAVTTDNAGVFGNDAADLDQAAADAAAAEAFDLLERYLDAQFRDPVTRLSPGPVSELLAPHALESLTEADRRALGDMDPPFTWTVTGPANARARVLLHGDQPLTVALSYDARLWVAFEEGRDAPLDMLAQRGSLVFSPTDEGWRVTAVDVRLIGPRVPSPDDPEVETDV